MIPYIILYPLTCVLGLLYAATIPWGWYEPGQATNLMLARLGIWLRIVIAAGYLAVLLLYLPTIHFILNTVFFMITVGVVMWYRLVRKQV